VTSWQQHGVQSTIGTIYARINFLIPKNLGAQIPPNPVQGPLT